MKRPTGLTARAIALATASIAAIVLTGCASLVGASGEPAAATVGPRAAVSATLIDAGTPAALPHTTLFERGYKGQIYQTHAAANKEFLKVGGKAVEGGILPIGPAAGFAPLQQAGAGIHQVV